LLGAIVRSVAVSRASTGVNRFTNSLVEPARLEEEEEVAEEMNVILLTKPLPMAKPLTKPLVSGLDRTRTTI